MYSRKSTNKAVWIGKCKNYLQPRSHAGHDPAMPLLFSASPSPFVRLGKISNATKCSLFRLLPPPLPPPPKAREAIKFMVRLSRQCAAAAAIFHFHFHFMEMRSELHVSCCSDGERRGREEERGGRLDRPFISLVVKNGLATGPLHTFIAL